MSRGKEALAGACCDKCHSRLVIDVSVSDSTWQRISPKPVEGWKGGGILCPQCIVTALDASAEKALAKISQVNRWADALDSPQAEAIRRGKIDHTEILAQFDRMERELHQLRAQNVELRARAENAEEQLAEVANYMDAECDSDSILHEIMEAQSDKDSFKARAEKAEEERDEAHLIIEERDDRLALVDRVADLIGLPQDQELDQVAFEMWFSTNASTRASDDTIKALTEALEKLLVATKMLQRSAEGCAVNHYGEDFSLHGMPGWLADTYRDIEAARETLASLTVKDERT